MRQISAASRIGAPVAAAAAHDAALDRLEGQRQAEQHGGGHVDPEDLQRRDRQRGAGEDGGEDDQAFAKVGRQRPGDELDQVVVNAAPFLDRRLDGGEVVVGQHHRRRLLGHFGAALAPWRCRCRPASAPVRR
jgi:Ni/Co efflux regulator RcnB